MGGGGYGDPIDRDPDLVLADVLRGLVSSECAKDIYGVIIDLDKGKVDLSGTVKHRESIRKNRLDGVRVKVVERVSHVKETDHPINEYLQLVEGKGGKSVQCKWCGKMICQENIKWKEKVPAKLFPTSKAGPFRPGNDQFFLSEFYCPSCATLLETEVLKHEDQPLCDEILY